MTTPDIRVVLQPDGVQDVIAGLRQIRRESQGLKRDTSAWVDPFSKPGGFVGLFDKAEPAANKFGLTLGSVLGVAQRLIPALGFAGAMSGLISLGRNSLQTAEDVSKLNQQFRISAEEITTLQFLARTNQSTNDELERGLAGLSKSQRELAAGTEDTVAAYADLNLTAKDFQGLNLAESFALISQRIQGIDPTKLNLDEILGRNARKLIPSLNELAEKGLGGVQRAGERAGAVLSTDSAKGIKSFSDEIDLAKESIGGLGNALTGFLAPALTKMVQVYRQANDTVSSFIRLDAEGAARGVASLLLQKFGLFDRVAGKPKAETKGGAGGKNVDEAAQRQIIEANRKRAEEQFKLLADESQRRKDLANASIDAELQIAETRAATNKDQIQGARDLLAAQTNALSQRVNLATSTAQTENAIVDARYQNELRLARQASASDAGFAARRVDIDRKAAQDRAKIAQTYYTELQRLESQALAQFRASKEAQKSLEAELRTIKQSASDFAFENKIAGSGPASQLIAREEQAQTKIKELKDAAARGDIERARQVRSEIESQARTIGGLDTVAAGDSAEKILAQANAIFEPLLQKQIEIEKQREASAKAAIVGIGEQIKAVEQEILKLQEKQLNVKVGVDDASLQAMVRSIQEQLGRTPFQIAVQPVVGGAAGSVPGLADGGPLGGYSPGPRSDNLLFAGTAGEYMQPVPAVRKYGTAFMDSVRDLTFPGFADGGLLGGGRGSGGAPGVTGDRTELSLNINGRKLGSVFGSRDTVRALTDALQQVAD